MQFCVCVCKERTVESVGMFDLARSRGSSEPSLTHTTLDFPERTWEQGMVYSDIRII